MYDKKLFVAYYLCLVGGPLGLHHFYLGRDYHGLVWLMTGGVFFFGIIRDIWKIPVYVDDANNEYTLNRKMLKHKTPPNKLYRNIGQFIFANVLGLLGFYSIPPKLIPLPYIYKISTSIVPFASAVGVYLVGNIGRQEGKFKDALIGAYLTFPVTFVRGTPIYGTIGISSIASCVYFNKYSKRWRRTSPYNKSAGQRIKFILFSIIIYLSLLSSMINFNCYITIQDEKSVKCLDAVKNFFQSPLWSVMKELFKSLDDCSWQENWQKLIEAMDLTGEANAFKVLGLNETATLEEITIRCIELSKIWIPDKHQDQEKKQIAQEMFTQIQQAYEILFKMSEKKYTYCCHTYCLF